MPRLIASSALVTLLFTVGATVWYSLLTPSLHGSPIARGEPRFALMLLGNFAAALVLARLVAHPAIDRRRLAPARLGALLGVLWFLPTNLMVRGIWEIELTIATPLDTAFHAALAALAAVVVGRLHRAP